jgi:superfamily I DNA/RNA helicase
MSATFTLGWQNENFQPTPGQRAILTAIDKSSLISALAGSGKTTTLCMAACNLMANRRLVAHGNPKYKILMLAHSTAGLTAIKDRFRTIHGRTPDGMYIMTVEQLCQRALISQGQSITIPDSWQHKKHLVEQARLALSINLDQDPDEDVSHLLAQKLDVDAFNAFESMVKRRLLPKRMEESEQGLRDFCDEWDLSYAMFRLYRQYERMRLNVNNEPSIFCEGDCTYEMCRQIDELDWDTPHRHLTALYDAVLVDELHDLDEASLNVLRSMIKGNNGVFIGTGDFNQHILEDAFSVFGDGMVHIREALPEDTQVLHLNQTRRFGSNICDGLNNLFKLDFTSIKAHLDYFSPVSYVDDEDCCEMLRAVHEQVKTLEEQSQGPREGLCIILRNPHDSILLEWTLINAGIHYVCQGMSPFFMRREIALVLMLMWAIQGEDYAFKEDNQRYLTPGIILAGCEGLAHFGQRHQHTGDIDADVITKSRFDFASWRESSDATTTRNAALSAYEDVRNARLLISKGLIDKSSPSLLRDACARALEVRESLLGDASAFCDHANIRRIFLDAHIEEKERSACLHSLDSLSSFARGLTVHEVLGMLTIMAMKSIERHQSKALVTARILSVEASKGREFKYVAVPFVEKGRFPASVAHEKSYLERNKLYVAMTRAKSRLWLLGSQDRPVKPLPV